MKFSLPTLLMLFCIQSFVFSQSSDIKIAIISDNNFTENKWFESEIQSEIIDLLGSKYNLTFSNLPSNSDINKTNAFVNQVFADPEIDVVIGTGIQVGNILAKQNNFPKPTIASIIIDNELQNIQKTDEGTSGIDNFTYVHSPFNLLRDVNTLHDIIPFKKLGIIGGTPLRDNVLDVNAFYNKLIANHDAEFAFIQLTGSVDNLLSSIPGDVDAVYLLPVFDEFSEGDFKIFFDGLAERKLPCVSLLSSPYIELGAYASFDSEPTINKIPRRIALNVLKVLEGTTAASLQVELRDFSENLIINMKTVNKIGLFPSWQILTQATLINVDQVDTDRVINLKSCIAEALSNNLEYKIAQNETSLVERDVAIAKSDYLPQVDFSSTGVFLDPTSVENSFGFKGDFTWTATGNFSQLILSEPALANIAIQKLLYETQKFSQDATELDIILDVAEAYFGVLLAEAFVSIQRENVNVTRKNYDIALAKEAVGYSGTTDVYRWQSQLALNKIELNDSHAQLKQVSFNLNQILNRPIKDAFLTTDSSETDNDHFQVYLDVISLLKNPSDMETYSDFLVSEAFNNLPDIKQLENTIQIQNRLLKSNKRAYYLPTIGLSAQYDYDIKRIGVVPFGGQELPEIMPVWNAAVGLQLPIFQGNRRNKEKQQTEIQILLAQDNLADLRNKLELQVRSTMETARASFSNWILSKEAAIASRKNFTISQNSYQQGLLNVVSLIDAQNAALQSELNATTAKFQFLLDFMAIERAIGRYYFLLPEQERTAFFERYIQFSSQNK